MIGWMKAGVSRVCKAENKAERYGNSRGDATNTERKEGTQSGRQSGTQSGKREANIPLKDTWH